MYKKNPCFRLTNARVIRICDGALAEELFPDDYETTPEITKPMPIRWMSPECLKAAGNFNKASDVVCTIFMYKTMTMGLSNEHSSETAKTFHCIEVRLREF